MPDAFWANLPTLVISCGTFVGLIIAAIAQYIVNTRLGTKLETVAKATDGLATKMAEAAKGQGAAEGKLAGVQQERTEARDRIGQVKSNDRRGSKALPEVSPHVLEKIEANTKNTAEATADVAAAIKKDK